MVGFLVVVGATKNGLIRGVRDEKQTRHRYLRESRRTCARSLVLVRRLHDNDAVGFAILNFGVFLPPGGGFFFFPGGDVLVGWRGGRRPWMRLFGPPRAYISLYVWLPPPWWWGKRPKRVRVIELIRYGRWNGNEYFPNSLSQSCVSGREK
jgi:hypothetical protein